MKGTTSFRKKSAIVLFGVMTLGLSAHMMTSAVSEIGDAGNKTLQIVKGSDAKNDSHLFLDLKNKNESSFLYTDNTNKNTDFHANKTNENFSYINGTPKNKVKSGLRKNTKAALGVLSSSAIAAGTGYAVKKFVANKGTSEEVNQSLVGKEKQSNDYKGTSEEVNQSLGKKEKQNSDNKGTSEKVDQSVGEKEKQNSDNKGSSEKVNQSLDKQGKHYNNERKENKGKNDQGSVTSGTIDENKNGANTQEPISKSSELNSEKVLSSKIIALEGLLGLIIFGVLVTLAIIFKNSESSTEDPNKGSTEGGKKSFDNENVYDNDIEKTSKNNTVIISNEKIKRIQEIFGFTDENNNVIPREKQIKSIQENLGFNENLAGEFYDLLLDEKFEQAAKAASKFFSGKFDNAGLFVPDPGFDYGGIVIKVNKCIDAIKRAYKVRKDRELGDDNQIFCSLGEIAKKCNKKISELGKGDMDNFKLNY